MNFTPTPQNIGQTDLLLINPDFSKNELGAYSAPENHLGLNRLAGYLDNVGHSCSIIDTTGRKSGTKGPEELGKWILDNVNSFKTIGFHTNSWNINHILRILDVCKTSLINKKILFGGPLASSEPKKMTELFVESGLQNIGLVQGMGEEITDKILTKERLSDVEGLWVYENGRFIEGKQITLSQEKYENTPFLNLNYNTFYQNYYKPVIESGDLDDYSLELIFGSQGLDVNRGCPFNCTYCSVPQYEQKMVTYTPKRVVDELEYLAKEAGFFMFTFTNSNIMFYDEMWITEFCQEIIGRGMNEYINWTAYHHPSIIAKLPSSTFNLMKKAGSDTIVFGIQSFDEKILKTFLRPINTKELTEIIRDKTIHSGQYLVVDYITGVPGEDLDIIEKAFNYFIDNDIECRNYQLKFYPNTKLPLMNLDLSDYDLVPITGELAPELNAYAIVSKHPNPRSAKLDGLLREANTELIKKKPPRFGKYIVDSAEKAKELYEKEIPDNPNIPDKVKRAMRVALHEMLYPKQREQNLDKMDPVEMMRKVILADNDAPPMLKAMQAKLKNELGEDKFNEIKDKYENGNL
ncbi:radical SAM protein [Candidatus Peregrinibacteria bacterium]|nr:radical SAM protein [Candidatus Peregrinibacteria bacterium]